MDDWNYEPTGIVHGNMSYLNEKVDELVDSLKGNESAEIIDSLAESLTNELVEDTNLSTVMDRQEIKHTILESIFKEIGEQK